MGSQRRFTLIASLLMLTLLLAACERPFQADTQIAPPSDTGTVVETPEGDAYPAPAEDPAVVAEETAEEGTTSEETEEVAEEVAEEETSPRSDTETTEETESTATEGAAEETAAETTTEEEAAPEETATEEETPSEETATEETPAETTTEEEAAPEETATEEETPSEETATEETPAETTTAETADIIHTVTAGETLFRIGLRYDVSWVVIADYNEEITDPTRIYVGQQIKIPTGSPTDVSPTPVPTDGNTYVVKPGDTLFQIGQNLGIDWRLIAEANGIINPNYIVAGTTLKIPSDEPGPTPEFTHKVQHGETLFIISLNYGVTWTTIAEANDIDAPYVIYPGEDLIIPSSN